MSATEQVTRLEALLERVNTRRGAPRRPPVLDEPVAHVEEAPVVHAAAAPAPRAPEPVAARVVPPVAVAPVAPPPKAPEPVEAKVVPPVAAAPVAPPPKAPEPVKAPEPPPPVMAHAAPAAVLDSPNVDVEVEVEEGVAEVDLEGLDEELAASSLSDSVADLDTVAGGGEAEAPVSSRRTVQMQSPLEELAFGAAAAAKGPHPAPPESGRQVAIPDATEAEGDLLKSGVRPAPVLEPVAPLVETAPPAAPLELKADVTRPVIPAAAPAVFRGAVPIPVPATFGELLEATLAL